MNKKMSKCKACGNEIANGAKACPFCGKDSRNFFMKHKIITAVLILFLLGSIGGSLGSGDTSKESEAVKTATQENVSESAPVEETDTSADSTVATDSQQTEDQTASVEETQTDTDVSSASASVGEMNALSKAYDYLDYTGFSHSGLIEQLKYEGFSDSEAAYAADNCGADWNEQAAIKAKEYMDYTSFSRSGLIEQLEYEGFSSSEAAYGATAVGY